MKDKIHEVNLFPPVRCMSCSKEVPEYYAPWGNSGTCSRTCEEKVVRGIHERWKNAVSNDGE